MLAILFMFGLALNTHGLDLFWLAFAASGSGFVWMTAFGRPDDD
jgi:hypothetical protein